MKVSIKHFTFNILGVRLLAVKTCKGSLHSLDQPTGRLVQARVNLEAVRRHAARPRPVRGAWSLTGVEGPLRWAGMGLARASARPESRREIDLHAELYLTQRPSKRWPPLNIDD